MSSINILVIKGNLTGAPDLKVLSSGTPVCGFCVAINSKFTNKAGEVKESVDFVDVVVWNKPGENCAKYLEKGQEVFVEGRLQLDVWEDSEGRKHRKLKCVARRVDFGRKPKNAKASDSESSGEVDSKEGRASIPSEDGQDSRDGQEIKGEDIPF